MNGELQAFGPQRAIVGPAVAVLLVAALLLPWFGTPAHASDLPAEERHSSLGQVGAVRIPVADHQNTSRYMWVSSAGRRGYLLTGMASSHPVGFRSIESYDLETGERAASRTLERPAFSSTYAPGASYSVHRGTDRSMVVDESGGRLFVATNGGTGANAVTGTATEGNMCLTTPNRPVPCVGGVTVLDADSLEAIRHIPLRSLMVDGGGALAPQLAAMEYAPSHDGQPAKLHLLVREHVHAPDLLETAAAYAANPRQLLTNLTYLVQLDPETGAQDWSIPLHACGGSLHGSRAADAADVAGYSHQEALFRGLAPGDRAVYVACRTNSRALTVGIVRVPLDEAGAPIQGLVLPDGGSEPPNPEASQGPVDPTAGAAVRYEQAYTVEGPDRVYQIHADPDSGRFVVQVMDGQPAAQVWWVFDTAAMQFIGTIGIGGPVAHGTTMSALDRAHGRLYLLALPLTASGRSFEGGLFTADVRRTPVAQALHYPEAAALYPPGWQSSVDERPNLIPQTLPDGVVRLWLPDGMHGATTEDTIRKNFVAFEDRSPHSELPPVDAYTGRTLDLDEADGVTQAAFDGAARGYGMRMLLVGGAEAAARMGPFDPVGTADECNDPDYGDAALVGGLVDKGLRGSFIRPSSGALPYTYDLTTKNTSEGAGGPCYEARQPLPTQCTKGNREVVLALVGPEGPAIVDGQGTRGAARPFAVDSATLTDADAPVSRCTGTEWEAVWTAALFGRPPIDEPRADAADVDRLLVECVAPSDQRADALGDPVMNGYKAQVDCTDGEASGFAYMRGGSFEGVSVAETLSSFRIYRDPGRGIVSRVDSVVRGVDLDGQVRIDTIRGVAESWANGRRQPVSDDERDSVYEANCDFERSAGTCFRRQVFGVTAPGYRCGPCGDEQSFIRAMNAVFNPNAMVRLRDPDVQLRRGTENGFIAAVQKPETERFADLILNSDLFQTVLPTLEFVRFAAPNRNLSRMGARGRQIYQFAGVEVSSSYGISCLLVYDEAANTCAGEKLEPGSIVVSLSDSDGKPLAGGAFEVRQDVDADGVLGLKDTLLANGACVTADDGVGTCKLENLQPGSYLVNQVAAPPGYAKSAEPFVVDLASGEQRTVAFTNVSSLSTVDVKATDENGAPVSGATFAAYPDADSDGKVAPDAKPAAECTTDGQGVCQMKVPAGSYVLVQTSAPGGLEGIEPVPFTFASGGQVASVTVVNYPPASPAKPEPPASPIYTPPVDQAPPREFVDDTYVPVDSGPAPDIAPAQSVTERVGGTVTQVIRAPGDALRLLARDPKQAVAWTAALALFGLAAVAVRRRHQALALLQES